MKNYQIFRASSTLTLLPHRVICSTPPVNLHLSRVTFFNYSVCTFFGGALPGRQAHQHVPFTVTKFWNPPRLSASGVWCTLSERYLFLENPRYRNLKVSNPGDLHEVPRCVQPEEDIISPRGAIYWSALSVRPAGRPTF